MHRTSLIRPLAGGAAAAFALIALSTTAASAGEWTGNGQSLKDEDGHLNGSSICAFSGLNDTYSGNPDVPDGDGFTRTQNWGQVDPETRALLGTIGLHPGDSCKPGGGGH
ncbi:hypothetical protein [Nocardioides cavernaquae]|uniref:Secreted protein n=1 Tax=Nocardioides cavernaquae TaxID=2321396 RepID=A0A3A5HBG2_9ACTN|nr:hypothetical protein [Nocardioides cavernaquae]RJS45317.1 hypothetical protein D4739_03195 [Nocardioides cavernaquae]